MRPRQVLQADRGYRHVDVRRVGWCGRVQPRALGNEIHRHVRRQQQDDPPHHRQGHAGPVLRTLSGHGRARGYQEPDRTELQDRRLDNADCSFAQRTGHDHWYTRRDVGCRGVRDARQRARHERQRHWRPEYWRIDRLCRPRRHEVHQRQLPRHRVRKRRFRRPRRCREWIQRRGRPDDDRYGPLQRCRHC